MKTKTLLFLFSLVAAVALLSTTAPGATQKDVDHSVTNRYGGPVYRGAPALEVTAALVRAGGGASDFSIQRALVSMLGEETVNNEVAKLAGQYGDKAVGEWVATFDFAVADALRVATEKGVQLPAPADLSGPELASALVRAGTDRDGAFWAGLLFDRALSHGIHHQVMDDITEKWDAQRDAVFHQITNQALFDVARALGHTDVKLSRVH